MRFLAHISQSLSGSIWHCARATLWKLVSMWLCSLHRFCRRRGCHQSKSVLSGKRDMWKHPSCLPDKHFNCLFLLEWAFWVCISSYVSENSRLPYWPLPLPKGEGSLQDLEEIQLLESLDSWHIYSLNHCIFSSSPRLWNDHEWRRSCVISIRFQASHSYKHIDLLSHEFPMLWRIPSCFTTFLIASLSRFTAKGLTYAGTSLFRIILQIFLNSNTSAFNFSRLFLVSLFMLFGPCFQHLR